MNKKVLYITYDGLCDPLGRAQIIPYLAGLADYGYDFTVLSCEKKDRLEKEKIIIEGYLKEKKINWVFIPFIKNPPALSTCLNFLKLRIRAISLHKRLKFSMVHCRSYIPSIIGLAMQKKFDVKFIFDMRGLWIDERVDGKLWNLENPVYKISYRYFKNKEKDFLIRADYIVSLTEAAVGIIRSWSDHSRKLTPVAVIPCCADTDSFSPSRFSKAERSALKSHLGMSKDDLVLTYHGSLGTWYCTEEMLHFFKRLLITKPGTKFLFLTQDNPSEIHYLCDRLKIPPGKIIIRSVPFGDMPLYLSISDFSIFFIKPAFSKKASSPTKLAEALSMGVPVICNTGVGDTEEIIKEGNCGLLIGRFHEEDYDGAIAKMHAFYQAPVMDLRDYSIKKFSHTSGVEKYRNMYASLLS